jgi:hypothetical protein
MRDQWMTLPCPPPQVLTIASWHHAFHHLTDSDRCGTSKSRVYKSTQEYDANFIRLWIGETSEPWVHSAYLSNVSSYRFFSFSLMDHSANIGVTTLVCRRYRDAITNAKIANSTLGSSAIGFGIWHCYQEDAATGSVYYWNLLPGIMANYEEQKSFFFF